jgi:hypothetical protein
VDMLPTTLHPALG